MDGELSHILKGGEMESGEWDAWIVEGVLSAY